MQNRTSPFETLGHVVCGLLILGACEAAHDGRWLVDRPWPPNRISLYLTSAYIIGQLVASLSRFAIEQAFFARGLGIPQEIMFASDQSGARIWRNLCMGLLIVAAILMGGMLWHSLSANWGKSDWRKLGYCALALLEAGILFQRWLNVSRCHVREAANVS